MKRFFITIFLLLLLISCAKINKDQLYHSKWYTILDDDYYKMWFCQNHVLLFKPINDYPEKFEYETDGRTIDFYYLNDKEKYFGYSLKIQLFEEDELTLQLVENKKVVEEYKRIDDSVENCASEIEYDSYFEEYLNRRNAWYKINKPLKTR